MMFRPIRTETDYEAALSRAGELMTSAPGTAESDELDVLATLIERYEDEQAPMPPADPIDAILFRLEQSGQTTHDLREILGVRRNRVSEILNRKRSLSLDMIRRLSVALDIPAEVLLETDATRAPARAPRARRRAQPALRESARSAVEPEGPLPDLVFAHLRADRAIDPTAADLLGTMFQAAYEQATSTASSSDEPHDDA